MSAGGAGSAVRVRGLCHAYSDGPRALAAVDLEGRWGEVLGLMGPNGSGKSTLLRAVARTLVPTAGSVDLSPNGTADGERPAVVFDRSPFADELPARENVSRLLELRGATRREARRRADAWLDRFGLPERADDPVGGFSRGMRRKTDLAAAFAAGADLLLLDEPLEGLDAPARGTLATALAEHADRGGAALLTGHSARFMERVCHRVVFLGGGEVVARGSPEELIREVDADTTVAVELDGAGGGLEAGLGSTGRDDAPGTDSWPPDVRLVGREGDTLRFAAGDGGASLPALCRLLLDRGAGIAGVRVRRPDLDDAYLARAGEPLSEDG